MLSAGSNESSPGRYMWSKAVDMVAGTARFSDCAEAVVSERGNSPCEMLEDD